MSLQMTMQCDDVPAGVSDMRGARGCCMAGKLDHGCDCTLFAGMLNVLPYC
jgi:hypothetical protein